ncbi:ACP phosphodiesterase [Roseivirga ehrenbergii]|uniref:ACP phosphodiesterase n=1 Tax=Roseivirga ehrenbergii (strain DSM 102268 / JCM 13514 / KCTC 12282 / NCIMB 14502 / KMM 6017) TaxID=279360 RepID=A0A150WXJ0_ROSEK|nr:ACP phosphodiesterase [Roseivirga ehrenbergii]
MNYLAHLYLSGSHSKIAIGNFLGDFVKGSQYQDYEPDIAKGVLLHREIDRFTDSHEVVSQSKKRLSEKYRHYSGVIVDMFYDHFLAKNFSEFHSDDLKTFSENHFKQLLAFQNQMPSRAQHMLPYMVSNNWLLAYAEIKGIHRALLGLSRRTKFDSKMDESIQDLTRNYSMFEEEFRLFFPDIQLHISEFREDLINS